MTIIYHGAFTELKAQYMFFGQGPAVAIQLTEEF